MSTVKPIHIKNIRIDGKVYTSHMHTYNIYRTIRITQGDKLIYTIAVPSNTSIAQATKYTDNCLAHLFDN